MKQAVFRFYAELNEFLPPDKQYVSFPHSFSGRPSIRDLVEALGVPRSEIDLILANGDTVDFSYQVQHGDRISVYPVFETFDITPVLRVRSQPLRVVRFVLDPRLEKLAQYLRMLGFDALYGGHQQDEELVRTSIDERRTLLTKQHSLLENRTVTHGYFVRDTRPRRQLIEVVRHYDLYRSVELFKRCIRCNALMKPVSDEHAAPPPPSRLEERRDAFSICPQCNYIYWKGPHFQRMNQLIEHVLAQVSIQV